MTLARFLAVGAGNTLLTLAVYALLLAAGLPYLAALAPAYALGALNGYTLNRAWTFRAGSFRGAGLARYVLVQGAGLGLNAALLAVLVGDLGADELLGQVFALPVVTGLVFLATRSWVFSGSREGLRESRRPSGA
ncbi:MAG: GtrA family protein [Actinomycetota bacterium]|nr:GtrA family protein [Actinomycetota bacterium]